jgi:NadR type nicotinamide-nucleotide adenylyltransferase
MYDGILLMTALLPTRGHQYLIDFASEYAGGKLLVIISSRSKEPIAGEDRYKAFRKHYLHNPKVIIQLMEDDDAPQNPSGPDDEPFWAYWKNVMVTYARRHGISDIREVYASEPYGQKLADLVGARFVPCDIARQILHISSTEVRQDTVKHFHQILPEMQQHFQTRVTIFGAESCGKTTMAKKLHTEYDSYFVPEWAREFLETVGTEITEEKMETIYLAQYASQKATAALGGVPYIFQDTDLLSTIGYYKIMGYMVHPLLVQLFNETKSDLYIVMNDGIPFEKDPLRYGGDVRQSGTQFWIDLLEKYECNYYVVQNRERDYQLGEVKFEIDRFTKDKFKPIVDFQRE